MKIVRLPATLWLAVAGYGALAQPEIRTQPADTSVSLGATAQFTVITRTTAPPLAYQWWFQDAALDPDANPSASRPRLSLTNVTLGNAGAYYVVVSDAGGSITSRTATLNVDPQFTKITEGPVATDRVESWSGHFGDYDGDGLMDLVVTGDYWTPGSRNTRLYHNEGEGRFTAVISGPWENLTDRVFYGAWADPDNDGDLDLLLSVNESQTPIYLRNEGGGEFTRRPVDQNWFQPPVSLGGQSGSPAWGDLDNDGLLDGILQGPSTFPFRNLGNGQFTVLTNTPMYRLPDWAQSYQLVDYDNDGDLDVFLPREASSAKLYRNDGQLRFTDVSTAVLKGRVPSGAGGSWADFDNDGDLDVICAGGSSNSGVFLVNNGDGTFADWQGNPAALATAGGNWGIPTWGDYDNDGWLDLFTLAPGRLFHNLGDGNFEEITTGSPVKDTVGGTKSAAWADYDNNGTLDLFVASLNSAGNLLYQNNGNGRHWLKIRLKGTASNSHGIGARITVQATLGGKSVRQRRDISAGPVIQELEAHFGLGDATVAEVVRIEWPSGNVQELSDQAVDRVLKITEPTPIQPPRPSASLGGAVRLRNALGARAYQWQFNGVDLAGETRQTLTLTNIQIDHHGRYSVVVTGAEGMPLTNHTFVFVDTQFTTVTQGPVVTDPVRGMSGKFGDYDGDGRLDLAFLGDYWHVGNNARLYHNEGSGQFSAVTTDPWESLTDRASWSAWADTDNDGDLDLFLAANENDPPVFLRNDGGGVFTRFTVDKSWTSNEVLVRGGTSAWGDFDNDGFLDAVVGNGSTTHPLHNNGDGTFTRLTEGSSYLGGPGWTDTFDWVDYDHDGDLDLFVAKEDALSRLHRNDGHSRFTDVTLSVLQRRVGQGFGGAWGDYDNDGDFDLFFVGNDSSERFLINNGDGTFSDWAGNPHALLSLATGLPVWGDYDNDGHLDLLITQYGSHSRLFRSLGDGSFVEVTVGSLVNDPTLGSMNPAEPSGITAAWADYDNDGDLDVFVACDRSTGNYLYENNGNGNHWLKLRLHGTVSNRSAVGAQVSVRAAIGGQSVRQLRQITAQSAVQELEAHFGLGKATHAHVVRIEWPSGIVQELTSVSANQILTVTEPPALEALGEGRIRILCWARQNYELEVSDDLDTWTSLGVVATDQNRPVVLDPGAGERPYRFYRTKGQ
jgi:hypothetical protein